MDNNHASQQIPYPTAHIDGYPRCPETHESIQTEGEELATLKTNSHTAGDIEKWCIEHINRDYNQLSESQRDAQSKLQTLIAMDPNPDMRRWLSRSTMTKYMELFAERFFSKHMISYTGITMGDVEPDHDPATDPLGVYGVTSYDRKKGAPYVQIWLSKCLFLRQTDRVTRRAQILHTLLHEMTHAIFSIYCCRGLGCWTGMELQDTRGLDGHGPSWAAVFRTLRDKMMLIPSLEFISREGQMGQGLLQAIKQEMKKVKERGLVPHPYLVRVQEEETADLLLSRV